MECSSLGMSVRESGRNRRGKGGRGAPAGVGVGPAGPTLDPLSTNFGQDDNMNL